MADYRKPFFFGTANIDESCEAQPSLPTHERILLIARLALRDPSTLSHDEIRDLAGEMITHYAQMGIG